MIRIEVYSNCQYLLPEVNTVWEDMTRTSLVNENNFVLFYVEQ